MKQLYFILAAVAILTGCQPQEEVIKSHGIKEVHLVQFRYYFPEDSIEGYINLEDDFLEPKPKLVGYTSLQPQNGMMEVWTGFYNDSISHHQHGYASKAAVVSALEQFAALEADEFFYHDWENSDEMGPLYSGPQLFFQVVKEDGKVYTIGFDRWKLPEELKGLYKAMDYNSWELAEGKRIQGASTTKSVQFVKTIDDKLYLPYNIPPVPGLPPPPPPVRAKVTYTPPTAKHLAQ